jgi:hypothetical protein
VNPQYPERERGGNQLDRSISLLAARGARMKRLAQSIEALAEKDENILRHARKIGAIRRNAAGELHTVCAELVGSLNALLSDSAVALDPPAFRPDAFQEDGPNLFQINIRGRILQIEFETSPELLSTEDFRIPYTLMGSVRAFNQELLDKNLIEEQLVFYTLEGDKSLWRFFDARTYRSGTLDLDYLVTLLEQLL